MSHNENDIPNFPSFHVHPCSLDSASTPEAFAEKEIELGTGTLTVTDHGTMTACRRVYDLAKSKGLTPLIGIENYLRDDECPILSPHGNVKDYAKYFHVTTLFLDQDAYETAGRILSKTPTEKHGEEYKPLLNWRDFEEIGAKNSIIFSGCLIGLTMRHLLDHGSVENAEAYYRKMRSLAKPGNFCVEIMPHVCDRNWDSGIYVDINEGDKITTLKFKPKKKLKTNLGEIYAEDLVKEFNRKDNGHTIFLGQKTYRKWELRGNEAKILKVEKREDYLLNECTPMFPDGDVQKGGNEFVIGLAKKYGDLIYVNDDSHFCDFSQKAVQDVRLMASGGSWRMANSYHRLSGMECWDYFKNKMGISLKEFQGWCNNSKELASRFKNFKFDYKPELPSRFYPSDTLGYLKGLINKHGRMRWSDGRYTERLNKEIELFHNNGTVDLLPYFFVYEEIAELYQKQGLLTAPGRGSAAGTVLTYLLNITHIDPIVNNLSLERFITLDRIKSGSFPDIDFDLPDRTLLLGGESETIECETDDGRSLIFNKGQLVKTDHGMMKIEDAVRNKVEIHENT